MKGQYAGRTMGTYGAILPGAARLARLPAAPTAEATRRYKVVEWHQQHGGVVRLTARHYGFSPDTVSRWVRAFAQRGLAGLETRSRRPHRVRQPLVPLAVSQRLRQLREAHPRWGREKLRVLLLAEGIALSSKSIDRELARQRARGVLREPLRSRKTHAHATNRLRRPPDLVVDRPGALVQLDTKYVPLGKGVTVYQFGAVDYCTRKRVVALVPQLTSTAARRFLEHLLRRFPFPVTAIQTDNGPEFLGDFAAGARHLGLTHYYNRPYYPQGNGRIERCFKTDEEEFYQVEDLPAELRGLDTKLQAWNQIYETVRPHQALGYLTPDAFYQHWLQTHGKEALSDIS